MKLQVNVENTVGAESFTVMYKAGGSPTWQVAATTTRMPYNIIGLDIGVPYQINVKKNCKNPPCSPVGGISANWIE